MDNNVNQRSSRKWKGCINKTIEFTKEVANIQSKFNPFPAEDEFLDEDELIRAAERKKLAEEEAAERQRELQALLAARRQAKAKEKAMEGRNTK
jgi:hypothetical protein